ncbi:uncharacterized protein LOC114522206 [Dendronephthya gigantea]|uniref:uncharacterized protein LOC114522206 n=1 Tax=Dendronephthya gigantea TaxID=151771 RepID=UPI00106D692A|nr:uncharacterized protein LOC114522206 [Dendronephthya gigantea]
MANIYNISISECKNAVTTIGDQAQSQISKTDPTSTSTNTSTTLEDVSNCYEPVRSYCSRGKVDHEIEKIQRGKPKILNGTIGTGKTYASRHYIDENKQKFVISWFLDVSATDDSIILSLNDLAEKLGVQYRLLFETVKQKAVGKDVIFVLDNVQKKPSSEWFKKLWNIRSLIYIIITTNNASLFLSLSNTEVLQVEKFDEAMAFLQDIHPKNSEEDLKELCNHFGWNILGLTTAKDYMLTKKMTTRIYLKMLYDSEAAPKVRQNELSTHQRTLYASVRACLEEVDKNRFSALATVSFISNSMIPEFLLSNQLPSSNDLANTADLNDLHDQLKSLVQITEENGIRFFSFHPFTQYVIKDMIDEQVKADLLYKLAEIFVRYINKDNRFSKGNFLQRIIREHAKFFLQEWEDKEKDDRTAIALARLSELVGFTYTQHQPPMRKQSDEHFARARELIHNICGITDEDLKPADRSLSPRQPLGDSEVDQMYEISKNELSVAHQLFKKLTRKSCELSSDTIQELVFWRTVNKQDLAVFPEAVKVNQTVKEKIERSQPLSPSEVKEFVYHDAAYGVDDYRKLFLPELYLSVIYSLGRNYFYKNGEAMKQPSLYIDLLKLAYCLSREISEAMNENDAVYHEYTVQLNGLLYLLVNDDYICRDDIHEKKEGQVHAKDLMNAVDRYKQLECEERRFFEMGILKTTRDDTYRRLVCYRQILACYKALLSLNSIENRDHYVSDGVQICDDLLGLLETFTAQNALVQNSRYLNTIGEFYSSIKKDEYYRKAIDIFTKSAEKAKEDEVTLFHLEALVGLAEVYTRMGNRDHSLAYLTECEDKESLRNMKQQKPRIQQRMKKIQEQNIAMVAKAKQKPASHDERSDGDYRPCNENE